MLRQYSQIARRQARRRPRKYLPPNQLYPASFAAINTVQANAVSNLEDNLDNLCNVICDAQNGTLPEPDDNGVYGDVCHSRDDTDYATNSDA